MLYRFFQNLFCFMRRIIFSRQRLAVISALTVLLFFITPVFLFAADDAFAIKPLIKGDYAPAVTLISTGSLKETLIDFNPAASAPASASSKPPALVWFWFISCENCIRDMKFMRELHKKYSSKLSMIAVNVDAPDARGPVKNFIKNSGISAYQNYYDKITETPFSKSYDASDKFGITATPAVFIIDKTGRIALRAENIINFDEIEDYVETVLSE